MISAVFGESRFFKLRDKDGHKKYTFSIEKNDDNVRSADISAVRKYMNDIFKSISWTYKNEWGYSFDFRDPADEAYFLIWSSSRLVEIT